MDKSTISNFINNPHFYGGTNQYHKHFLGFLYTDGVKALADTFSCYWLVDTIVSYQYRVNLKDGFYIVYVEVDEQGNCKFAIADDVDSGQIINIRARQDFTTDVPVGKFHLYVVDGIILLPSEY